MLLKEVMQVLQMIRIQGIHKIESVFTATTLKEPNNKRYLQKNKIYFPKENHSIVSLLQYGRCECTLLCERCAAHPYPELTLQKCNLCVSVLIKIN